MKPIFKHSSPLLAVLALSMGTSHASDDFVENDIAIAFYEVTGTAPNQVVGPDTYIVNLGQGSLYRENTQNNVSVSTINPAILSSNISADLKAVFGDDWADSGTIYWCVVGGVSQTGATVNGDPARTSYYSRARGTFNTGATGPGTTIATVSSTNRGTLINNITPFLRGPDGGVNDGIRNIGANTSTSGVNVSGVVIPKTNSLTLDEYLPPTQLTFFGIGVDPRQRLVSGPLGGTAGLEGALDLYRIIHLTDGADLTAGASAGNAVVGNGQFIGTLTLDAGGNLKIQGVGTAAPAGSYTTTGDSDKDGISNLVEYALALNPAAADGAPGAFTNGTVSFTKRAEAVTNNDVTYAIQESDDLGITDPWETVTPTTNSTTVISYTLSSGSQKKFARLVVKTVP
jgi:hypothetical protein